MRSVVVLCLLCLAACSQADDTPINLGNNPFAVNMCDGSRCVGYERSGVTMWIYSVHSYQNNSKTGFTIDDDDYLTTAPAWLFLCTDNSTCPHNAEESISLQNATFTNLTPTKVQFDGKNAMGISYSLHQNDTQGRSVQVDIHTYLMQQQLDVVQEYKEGELYESDLVIAYNITWSGVSNKYYALTTDLKNQAATKVELQEDDANLPLQYQASTNDDDDVGFPFGTLDQAYDVQNGTYFNVSANAYLTSGVGAFGVMVKFPAASDSMSLLTYVASGHKIHKGWVVFLAILGGVTIALILAVGCLSYFFKKRKRSIGYDDFDDYDTRIQES